MNSNEIAWGIIKAVVILVGIYYIGIFLLGLLGISLVVIFLWLDQHWKSVAIGLVIGGVIGIALKLIQPIMSKYWSVYLDPRLNQSGKGWRWTSLVISFYCMFMFVIFGLASINMTRLITSTDVVMLLSSFFGAPIFLYLALRRSKNFESKELNISPESKTEYPKPPNVNNWKQVDRTDQLYCYQCTKKLSLKTWDNAEKSYCDACHDKLIFFKN